MLLYYHSWMFYIHFIASLYHFLGLTYWNRAQCQLLFFACFLHRRKSIWNGIQMQQNFLEIFFLPRRGPESPRGLVEEDRGAHKTQRCAEAPGMPWWVVGPMEVLCTTSQLYKYQNIPETLGESTKHFSSRRKFQNHEIQSRGLLRHSAGWGNDHGGVLHHTCCPSNDAWVVYHRPMGA